MAVRISKKVKLGILLLMLSLWILTAPMRLFALITGQNEETYEYYGYVPTYFNYTSYDNVIVEGALLDIVGYADDTVVSVYDITRPAKPKVIANETIGKMQLLTIKVKKGLYFKVVSSKPVSASIAGGNSYSAGSSFFYPSTDGGFAGKEFIFMAHPFYIGEMRLPGPTIHAIEDAEVTIYDAEGKITWKKHLKANSSYSGALFASRCVYRVVSTGRIMVANWIASSYTVLPSILGGYRGTRFYTKESAQTGGFENQQVVLLLMGQSQAADVKILDPLGQVYAEKSVQPTELCLVEGKSVPFMGKNTMVISSSPIIAFSGNMNHTEGNVFTNMRDGVAIFGIRPNEPTTFLVIAGGVVFSPEANARVTAGTLIIDIKKGGYASLPSGVITLMANTTLIVEVWTLPITLKSASAMGFYEPYTTENWVAYLITPRTVTMDYPPPKAVEEGAWPTPVSLGAAAVLVIALVIVLVLWKRPRKR